MIPALPLPRVFQHRPLSCSILRGAFEKRNALIRLCKSASNVCLRHFSEQAVAQGSPVFSRACQCPRMFIFSSRVRAQPVAIRKGVDNDWRAERSDKLANANCPFSALSEPRWLHCVLARIQALRMRSTNLSRVVARSIHVVVDSQSANHGRCVIESRALASISK